MPQIRKKILYPELSYIVCGLCFEVHNTLGRFRREKTYCDLLEQLLQREGIQYQREVVFHEARRDIADFVINNLIILEVKAKRLITKEDYYQTRRYLSAGQKQLGIIINFGQRYLAPKRVLQSAHS